MEQTQEQKTKKILSATDILDTNDVQFSEVEVPEWGGSVRLRTLTGEEAVKFSTANEKKESAAALLIALSAVDEDGNNIFSEEDIEAIKGKSLRAILTLQKAALELNGLSEAAKND